MKKIFVSHRQTVKHSYFQILLLFIVLLLSNSINAENLIKDNSSFECGNWGFQAIPYVFVQDWSSYKYPKVTKQTAAKGKYSLEVSNPAKRSAVNIWFPAFKVKSNTKIVCSFYAKSDTEDTKVVGSVECGFKYIISKSFKLDTAWKRYVLEGIVGIDIAKETSGGGLRNHYAFHLNLPSTSKPVFNKIWIDAVQIETNSLSDYIPGKKLDAAIELSKFRKKRFFIYDAGEKETASVRIYAKSADNSAYIINYQVIDELNGKVYLQGHKTGNLINEHAVVTFNLPEIKRRLYRIKAKVSLEKFNTTADRLYAGIHDLSKVNLQGRFGGSGISLSEPSSLRKHFIKAEKKYNIASYKRNPETIMKLAKSVGWRWVHEYQSVGILANQGKKGVYIWDGSDYLVNLYLKNGFKIMSNITSAGIFNTFQMPKWLLSGKPSLGGTWAVCDGVPKADVKEFGDFCKIVAKRYAGKINEWESWNEPGVVMRANEYLPYLKTCYKNIKEGNPRAMVIGLTGTKDRNGDTYGWVAECMKQGAGTYMDAIALHGYHITNRHYGNKAREIANKFKQKDWGIWDTESGVVCYEPYDFKYFFAAVENSVDTTQGIALYKPSAGANAISKHWLNEVVSGMTRISYFNLDTEYRHLGKSTWGIINYDGSPNAILLAQNFLIEFLDKANFYKEVPVAGDTIAYVFDKKKHPFVAYWNNNLNNKMSIKLKNIKLLDGLGSQLNKIEKNSDKYSIVPVNHNIRYLVASDINVEELVEATKNIEVLGLNPIKVVKSKINALNNKINLELSITNVSKDAKNISLNTISRFNEIEIGVRDDVKISPLSKNKIVLPVDILKLNNYFNKDINFTMDVEQTTVNFSASLSIMDSIFTKKSPIIDGDASDSIWGNPEEAMPIGDFAGVISRWNKKGLYFLIKVTDADPTSYKKSTVKIPTYFADCVEIFFDWNRGDDIDITKFNDDDTQLIFAALGDKSDIETGPKTSKGNEKFPLNLLEMKSQKTSSGYVMEIAIPWKCLKQLGLKRKQLVGFSISVKDVDNDFKKRKKAIWAGDDNLYKDTSRFGLLRMIK